MELRRLRLTTTPGAWRMFIARKTDMAFRAFRDKVLERDHYTCQFCGFQARDYQEVVNVDNDYRNNKLDNLATACVFCSQCFFLESIGVNNYGGGTLIYMPELTQTDINAQCHVLFCAIANGTAYKDTAQKVYRDLKFRAQVVENHFGEGSSRPAVYGRLLLAHEQSDETFIHEMLNDLRLLPAQAKFKTQIEAWAKAALEEAEPNT